MKTLICKERTVHFMLAALFCLMPFSVPAADVVLAGIIGQKALLVIDGQGPTPLAVGQSRSGVRVEAVQGDSAVVDIEGRRRTLRIGQHLAAGSVAAGGGDKVVLSADGAGHFVTLGAINGGTVRFLVDTGATLVAIGSGDARRLGIDTAKGQPVTIQTANGSIRGMKVKLDSVRVADLALSNVDAVVQESELPVILLGMSFLNRVEMQRDGATMILKKKY